MPTWLNRVKVKHLFTEATDFDNVQASMNAIADILDKTNCFARFDTRPFRAIPTGDDVFGPVDYANRLLGRMYDFADDNRIWLE